MDLDAEKYIVLGSYTELKPQDIVFWATQNAESCQHAVIWFRDANDNFCYFDYTPDNYPQIVIGKFKNQDEAVRRALQMVKQEGWNLVMTMWPEELFKEEEQ